MNNGLTISCRVSIKIWNMVGDMGPVTPYILRKDYMSVQIETIPV
jgi:hypothetical protein